MLKDSEHFSRILNIFKGLGVCLNRFFIGSWVGRNIEILVFSNFSVWLGLLLSAERKSYQRRSALQIRILSKKISRLNLKYKHSINISENKQ